MKKLPHPLLLICIIGFLLYGRALNFDYTNFDDNTLIQDNQSFIGNLSNFFTAFQKTVFLTGADVFYRPMETVWFMLNAQAGGENLFVYHFSSLLLHFAAVYLIFILLTRLNYSKELSLFLSLLFLVHPALAQAVAWVPGVVDILVTIFCVSSFLFFLNFLKEQKRKFFVLHLLFFLLALFTKETAVCLIPMMCIWKSPLQLPQRVRVARPTPSLREGRDGLSLLIGWSVVLVVWFMMRSAALSGQPKKEMSDLISSLFLNLPAFIQYIGKIILPFNLSVMPVMNDTSYSFGIVALIFLAAVVLVPLRFSVSPFQKNETGNGRAGEWERERQKGFFFGLYWFVLFLLPTFLSTNQFRIHQFYEHRLYLPLIGFLIFVAEIKSPATPRRGESQTQVPPFGGIKGGLAIAVLFFFFVLTFVHVKTFKDTESFLDNAVRTSPSSSLAHRNMGIHLQDLADQYKKAKDEAKASEALKNSADEYNKALSLNPHEKDLHNNLGVIYDQFGMKDKAEQEYLAETKLNPANPQSWNNLGVLYSQSEHPEKAESFLKKAIELNPSSVSTYQQLGLLYQKLGRKDDLERLRKFLSQNTKTNQSQNSNTRESNVGEGENISQQQSPADAEKNLLRQLSTDSTNSKTLFNLGLVYYSEKRMKDAEAMWLKAVKFDSAYTDAYNNLAIIYAQQGRMVDAEKIFKRVIKMNPNYADGYFNLANFYAKNGREKDALVYVNELKKRGITAEQFRQRGVALSAELQKIFDK